MPGISVYFDDEMISALEHAARCSGRTRSGVVRWIIENARITPEFDMPPAIHRGKKPRAQPDVLFPQDD